MARTPKLTDLQLVLLSTAASRDSGSLLPLPESVATAEPARLAKAIQALLKTGYAAESAATDPSSIWRENGDHRIAVMITDLGRTAIGSEAAGEIATAEPQPEPEAATPLRRPTKAAEVLALLGREEGATLAELVTATGWLPHTTRAALTGLRKKGHVIGKDKRGEVTCYRIGGVA